MKLFESIFVLYKNINIMLQKLLFASTFLILSTWAFAQSPVGVWKTIDDEDGREKSHIEIFEKNGKMYGKVIKLLAGASATKCDKCPGNNKGKNIEGMEVVWDLKKSGKIWDNGTILDPKTGKTYSCKIEFDGNDKLKVRGYMGISALGRTQTWYKVK